MQNTNTNVKFKYKENQMVHSIIANEFTVNNNTMNNSISQWVTVTSIRWHAQSETLLAKCSDGKTRQCRTSRIKTQSEKSDIANALRLAIRERLPVKFVAAGNNSADVWFCGLLINEEK